MDSGTKRLLLAASVLGAVLIGGMAAWTFTGHKAAGVPTIVADKEPMRVKPADPGGMAAIGVAEQGLGPNGGTSDVAPAAEQPDPQALLAQQRQTAAPKITQSAEQKIASTTPAAAPLAVTPQPAPVADSHVATQEAARKTSGPMVQLAALDSEAGATAEWQRLSHKLPSLLGDRKPVVERTEQSGRSFWRLRTGGFADVSDATQFCKQLRAKRMGCSLANF